MAKGKFGSKFSKNFWQGLSLLLRRHVKGGEPNFGVLLILLFTILVISPMTLDYAFGGILVEVFSSLVLIFSCYMMTKERKTLNRGLTLAIPAFVLGWLSRAVHIFPLATSAAFFHLLFSGYITYVFGCRLFSFKRVNSNIIHGSLCIYILLGMVFADVYILIELLHPGSFMGQFTMTSDVVDPENVLATWQSFYYLSFVTMSTLGYGDLAPLSAPARSFAIVETLAGQFYIATFVARLIGLYLRQMEVEAEKETAKRSPH